MSSSSSTPRKVNTGQLVQSERIHQLGHLVAGVIHELNNPLTIVNANLHVLEEYVGQLSKLIAMYEAAGAKSPEIDAYAEEIDLAYVQQDLPRILTSCQEGANRAFYNCARRQLESNLPWLISEASRSNAARP